MIPEQPAALGRRPGLRIVLVEDDVSIGTAICDAVGAAGYTIDWIRSGRDAMTALADDLPALVLLDAGLPEIDGFTICRWLRERDRLLPIIIVTARDADIDIVVGLDAGASDYVTKPFSMAVLLARIRAHLRAAEPTDTDAPIDVGPLRILPAAYVATVHGNPIELRPREFELLLYLARNAGRVVTRHRLLADVWDLHWESSTKTLDMHIVAVRRRLHGEVEIHTIRGVGYRLDAP